MSVYKAVLDTCDSYGPFRAEFLGKNKKEALEKMKEYLFSVVKEPKDFYQDIKIEGPL